MYQTQVPISATSAGVVLLRSIPQNMSNITYSLTGTGTCSPAAIFGIYLACVLAVTSHYFKVSTQDPRSPSSTTMQLVLPHGKLTSLNVSIFSCDYISKFSFPFAILCIHE